MCRMTAQTIFIASAIKQNNNQATVTIRKHSMHNLLVTTILSFVLSVSAQAETTPVKLPGNIAVHIGKTHYEHPVRLLHPYLDVWHMKGPLAEKAALKALKKRFAHVGDCSAPANVVLLLEPHMFYNAQLRVFHGEIIARAYIKGVEEPTYENALTVIKKQAPQNGDLGVKPDFYMEKAYAKAMDKVIKKLETDKAFLATLDKVMIDNPRSICDTLDKLPAAKFYY